MGSPLSPSLSLAEFKPEEVPGSDPVLTVLPEVSVLTVLPESPGAEKDRRGQSGKWRLARLGTQGQS